jgi:hypothetical protein
VQDPQTVQASGKGCFPLEKSLTKPQKAQRRHAGKALGMAAASLLWLLSACGQKGPLALPTPTTSGPAASAPGR